MRENGFERHSPDDDDGWAGVDIIASAESMNWNFSTGGRLPRPVLAGSREDLLELVDDQDQPGGPGGLDDLADQQVSVAGRVGQALADHRGVAVIELRQPVRELSERAGPRGHGDPEPG